MLNIVIMNRVPQYLYEVTDSWTIHGIIAHEMRIMNKQKHWVRSMWQLGGADNMTFSGTC